MSTISARRLQLHGREQQVNLNNAQKARMTVVESVYFQGLSVAPAGSDRRFGRFVQSDDDPYQRTCKLSQDWQPLDLGGYLDKVGMLCFYNEPNRRATIPTAEQKAEDEARVVEMGIAAGGDGEEGVEVVVPFAQVLPGESGRIHPSCARRLRLRCRQGKARCVVLALPE